jgi:septum formation protein
LKSSAFEGELQENEILVTSDTIVWHNDKAVGKPNDKQDAFYHFKIAIKHHSRSYYVRLL